MKKIFICVCAILFLSVFLIGTTITKQNSFSYTYKYKVKKGDNLYRIGKRFLEPWEKIAKDNKINNKGSLKVGRRLVIKKIFPAEFMGKASWYGEYFHGRKTANGEVYNMYGVSAAHRTLPLGSIILVKNPENGRQLKLRINDRGPYIDGRILDLSYGAAKKLGVVEQGVALLNIRIVSL